MKAQLVSFITVTIAVLVFALVIRSMPFGNSQKVMELSAKLEAAEEMAVNRAEEVIRLQRTAKQKDAYIQQLRQKLKTNRTTTHEKATNVYALPADSLAGHVANQIDQLNTAWY
jgi:hypothetical protein